MDTILRTEQQVRRAVERLLGHRIPDGFWNGAVRVRWVGNVLAEADADEQQRELEAVAGDIATMIEAVRQEHAEPPQRPLRRRAGGKGARARVEPGGFDFELIGVPLVPRSRRFEALHAIAKLEAERDGQVRAWRGVAELALSHRALPMRPLFAMADAAVWLMSLSAAGVLPGVPPVRALETLVTRLGARYGWSESDTLRFIVFGDDPRPSAGAWTFERGERRSSDRIVLSIHPSASRDDVVALFERALRAAPACYRRGRDASPQDAARAVFVAEVNDGRSWAEALAEWNRRHRKMRRSAEWWRAFARDCRNAWLRVTGEPLEWQAKGGLRMKANRRAGRVPRRAVRSGGQATRSRVV